MAASNPQLFINDAEKKQLLENIFTNLETNTMHLDQDSTLVLLDVDDTLAYLKNPDAQYNDFLMQALQDLAKDPKVKFCFFTKMSLNEIQNKNESEEHAKRTELLLYLKKKYDINIERIVMPGDLGHKHPAAQGVLQKHIQGLEDSIFSKIEEITQLVIAEKTKEQIELELKAINVELTSLTEKEAKLIELKQNIENLSKDPIVIPAAELGKAIQEMEALIPQQKAELPEIAAVGEPFTVKEDPEATSAGKLEDVVTAATKVKLSQSADSILMPPEDKSQEEPLEFELEELCLPELTLEADAASAMKRAETELKALEVRKTQLIKEKEIVEFEKDILHLNAEMKEFVSHKNDWDIPTKIEFFRKMQGELGPLYQRLENYPNGQKLWREIVGADIEQLLPSYSVMQKKQLLDFVMTGFPATGGSTFVDYYIPAYRNPGMIQQYHKEEGVVDHCKQNVSQGIMPRQEMGREIPHSKTPLLDAIFSDFFEPSHFPGKVIFFDDRIACITSVGRRIGQYNAQREGQGLYPVRYVGVHLCHDGIDNEFNRGTINTTVGQHLHEKGLLEQVESDERRFAYEQGRKFISAASVAGTPKHNKNYSVLLFDKDDTIVTRSHDGLDDGVPINLEIHELIFAYMAMHSDQIAWGMVSTGGGAMGDLADGEITHDADLSQFRNKVLHDGFNLKDPIARHKRIEHFYAGFYRRRPEFMLEEVVEIPANTTQLSKNDFAVVVQYGDITLNEKTGEITLVYTDKRRNLQYRVMPGDTVTLKTKNGLQIVVDLKAYIADRDLHRKGDNKVFQALDGMALAKVTVIPNEAMRAMGIIDIIAPEDFIFVSPERIFGLDDKKECVDAWKAVGFNGAAADSRRMFQSRAANAKRLKATAEKHKAEAEEIKRKTEEDQAEREKRKMELEKSKAEIPNVDPFEHEEKLLSLEKEILKLDEEILILRRKILSQRDVILDKNKDIAAHTERAQYYDTLAEGNTDTYIPSLLNHLGVATLAELKQRVRTKLIETTGAKLLVVLEKKLVELDPSHPLAEALNSLIADLKTYMANVADIIVGGRTPSLESFILRRVELLPLIADSNLIEWWGELKKLMTQFDERLKMCQDEVDEKRTDLIKKHLDPMVDVLSKIIDNPQCSIGMDLIKLRSGIKQYMAQVPPGACQLTQFIYSNFPYLMDYFCEDLLEVIMLAKVCDSELATYDAAKNEGRKESEKEELVSSVFQSRLFASIVPSTPKERAKDYVHPVTGLPLQLKIIHERVFTGVKDGTLQTRDTGVTRDVASTSGGMLYTKKVTLAADQILNAIQKLLTSNFDHTESEQRAKLIYHLKNLWNEANKGSQNDGTFAMFSDKTPARKALYNMVREETEKILNALDTLYPDAGAKISQNPQAMSSSSSSLFSRLSSKG